MAEEQAVLVKVADGITADLAAALADGQFVGLQFKPERSYADWLDDELDDLECLHVDVVPVGHEQTDLDDRESIGYVCSVDVGVRKKFGPRDNSQAGRIKRAEIDRLVRFIEELHEHFCELTLPTFEAAVWRETKIRTTFSRKHLREKRLFLGVIRLFFFASQDL